MRLKIGFSPCPNDTFIFDALVNGKIGLQDFEFEPVIEDVETLNKLAFEGELDITKLSYHAFAYCSQHYLWSRSGSALGSNCGPLLIGKEEIQPDKLQQKTIAIPGKYTTANFLLQFAFPQLNNKDEMVFSDIEGAILEGQVDAGVIIHENRFTYQQKGLIKLMDLGEYWEDETNHPIPLGGIAVKRELKRSVQKKIQGLIAASVEWAFANPEGTMSFVKKHAQEMDEEVMKQHIDLYVNDFTRNLGPTGERAVEYFYWKGSEMKILPPAHLPLFIEQQP